MAGLEVGPACGEFAEGAGGQEDRGVLQREIQAVRVSDESEEWARDVIINRLRNPGRIACQESRRDVFGSVPPALTTLRASRQPSPETKRVSNFVGEGM